MKDDDKNSGAHRMGENDSTEVAIKRPQGKDGRPARLVTIFGSLGPNGENRVHYVFDVGEPRLRRFHGAMVEQMFAP